MLAAATPSTAADFAGAEACAECHSRQFQAQRATHHAKALRRIRETPLAGLLDGQSLRERSGVRFVYRAAPEGVVVEIGKGAEHFTALLEWTFGAGSKAYTPVGRIGDEYFEHRVSWYKESGRLGLTLGHSTAAPADARSAVGILESRQTMLRCFNCHATAVESNMQPGVTCERCHGPGAPHIVAAKTGNALANTILNPGRFPAQGIVMICAECHRSPNARFQPEMPEMEDPVSVRFAPVGLLASQCFQKSTTFSCLTCHDPHRDPLPAGDPSYTKVCLGCHTTSPQASSTCRRARKTNCVGCHMKKASPLANLSFTDHRIRVYP